jgi:Amt family ammonium transporter
MPAIVIGVVAGILCHGAVRLKPKFGYDDALDVVGVHGVGGTWGALAAGLFASLAVNSAGANGLFYGNPRQLLIQAIAVASSLSFAFFGSLVLLKITDSVVGLRVDEDAERLGLDLSQHDENAYALEA